MNGQAIPPYKRNGVKSKKNRRLSKLLFAFFILISTIIFFNTPMSKITQIQITGLNLLTEEEIYQQSDISIGMQYLFLSTSKVKGRLLEMKELKDVDVNKDFPGKLSIKVTEHQIIAYLYYSKKEWVPILENGEILYRKNTQQFINRPLITNWKEEKKIKLLAEQLYQINPTILEDISEIQYDNKIVDHDQLILYTNEGYTVHVNLEDIGEKLNLLHDIIAQLKNKNYSLGDIYLLDSIRYEQYKDSGEDNDEG